LAERPGLRFGRVAEEYERVRSGYPPELVDKACATGGLQAGDAVVEIGPGTGKLTRELAARGLVVDAVEPDADLVEVARRAVSDSSVRFHVGTFEQVQLPESAFRAVFAATSYHWVDPDVGWRKVASLLEPDGVFALFGHAGGTQGSIDEEISWAWNEVTESKWELIDDEAFWVGADSRLGNVSELWSWLSRHELARSEAATLFRDVTLTREPFERALSVEDYLARIRTTNNYLHLEREKQQRLEHRLAAVLEAHGGTYTARYSAILVTARRA
jgi:SAM-dependent methyltransferase